MKLDRLLPDGGCSNIKEISGDFFLVVRKVFSARADRGGRIEFSLNDKYGRKRSDKRLRDGKGNVGFLRALCAKVSFVNDLSFVPHQNADCVIEIQ